MIIDNSQPLGVKPGLYKPFFAPSALSEPESPETTALVRALGLQRHIEGGYFLETDRSPDCMTSPYDPEALSEQTLALAGAPRAGYDALQRVLSTTIFYMITPRSPQGYFHRNRSRCVHSLHRGRGRYVLIHPADGRVESFVVGHNVAAGERLQWVVDSGVWKASYLLPDEDEGAGTSSGLLITETVVPGFEYTDHEFLSEARFEELLPSPEAQGELAWLLRGAGKAPGVEDIKKEASPAGSETDGSGDANATAQSSETN